MDGLGGSGRAALRRALVLLDRHRVLTVVVVGWMAAMLVFPTVAPPQGVSLAGGGRGRLGGGGGGGGVEGVGGDAGGEAGSAGGAAAGGDGAVAAGGPRSSVAGGGPGARTGTGGAACVAPRFVSEYARACVPPPAANPGATARGVSAKTIKMVVVGLPNTPEAEVQDEVARRAGFASQEQVREVRTVFLAYFNRVFELYGRKVELVEYRPQYNDRDREQACIDAARIVEQHAPFAVQAAGLVNLSTCLAERGVIAFSGGASYPESYLARYRPYIWTDLTECERVGHQMAEYVGKRLVRRPARWAGDPAYRTRTRKFGVWIPEDDVYKPCVEIAVRKLERQYGTVPVVVRYAPAAERIAQDARQAAIRFKAEGVTSVLAATDYNGMTVFTHAATSQDWRPEWVLVGAGNETVDNVARLYDQSQVDGHMFGRSPYGPLAGAFGPDGEPARVYRAETGRAMPAGTEGGYYSMLLWFDLVQNAGPVLTADNVERGARLAPPIGSPTAVGGRVAYGTNPDGTPGLDHSAQDDATEVYWDGSAEAFDGERGAFLHTYNARFFGLGEWPAEEPPVYPRR